MFLPASSLLEGINLPVPVPSTSINISNEPHAQRTFMNLLTSHDSEESLQESQPSFLNIGIPAPSDNLFTNSHHSDDSLKKTQPTNQSKKGKKRGKYGSASADNRLKIISAYQSNGDWKKLALDLKVPISSAYRWVQVNYSPKKRGGHTYTKFTNDHAEYVVSCVEENNLITLKEIKHKLFNQFGVNFSKETIRLKLDAMMYTLKLIRFIPETGNNDDNKLKRRNFVQQLMNIQSTGMNVVYMDETNFNLHCCRSQGRSKKGARASNVVAGSRGANIHLIGCIGTQGLIHYEIRRGSFKKESLKEWFISCLNKCHEVYGSAVCIVCDNAPCHSTVEDIFKLPAYKDDILLRMGPYSPMLNPIEMAWSTLKAAVKAELVTRMPLILQDEGRVGISKTEFRARSLENCIISCLPRITVPDCIKYMAKVQGLYPDALLLKDMIY